MGNVGNKKFCLECDLCGTRIDSFPQYFQCDQRCVECGSRQIHVCYFQDYRELKRLIGIKSQTRPGMWRYFDFLPLIAPSNITSLNEGNVGIERWKCLENYSKSRFNIDCQVYAHRQDRNYATGTFKDLAGSVVASVLREHAITGYVVASTGNIGVSFARYLKEAGILLYAFIPNVSPKAQEAELGCYGQKVFRVSGDYTCAKEMALQFSKTHGILNASGSFDPMRIEAKKTMAYEWLRLMPQFPTVYLQALSGGTGPLGIAKACDELADKGFFDTRPRLILVQSDKCSPMADAWAKAKAAGLPGSLRGITVDLQINKSVKAPPIPKALYHGVAMNLLTNALKAAVGGEAAAKSPRVVIKSWNEKTTHVFEVADTGVGIPPSIRKRIWDPLFTTTSAGDYNPLGSGMGLGLTLVKRLVSDVNGKVQVVDPPPGFSTFFSCHVSTVHKVSCNMSRILLFDDDDKPRNEIDQELSKLIGNKAKIEPFNNKVIPKKGFTYERHIEQQMRNDLENAPISLIACDKELGMYKNFPGLSANAISVVARNLGIPFCQYSRTPNADDREIARFEALKQWDSEDITLTSSDNRAWATEIKELWKGLEVIRTEYAKDEVNELKPAAAIATILDREDAATRISLYGSGDQSVLTEIFAFIDDNDDKKMIQRRMPRVLGTWLVLSILRFPGLLVNKTAAASYLNIAETDFAKPENQEFFKDAVYCGPFNGLDKRWWRDDLDCLLLDADASDGKEYLNTKNVHVNPCLDKDTKKRAGFYCMITQSPVSRDNSKGNINWFPSGADLSRIRNSKLQEITSLVSM